MTAGEGTPVVVGAGLSGMVVSDRLSEASVPHVLVGEPPDDQPRLGESIDPAGTLELLDFYPELDDYYYKKRWISVFAGDYATACNFSQKLGRTIGLRLLGFRSPPEFLHVDRIGFDRALYRKIRESDHCTRVESHVEDVDYDPETDTVEALHLQNGETLETGSVFDCTNHVRLLGRAIDVPVEWLGDPQQVVFTHYHAPSGTPDERLFDESWKHSTNLLRLYEEMDDLDGSAWAIPLGSYISVGVSMPRDQDAPEAETVMAHVEDAYRRRGMDFREVFENPKPPVTVPHQQYFMHERAFGSNWLLAGPSYGQVWFPSASGVGSSLATAALAPRFLQNPEQAGREYQAYVDGFRESHRVFDRMIASEHDVMSEELVKTESDRIIAENIKRVARLATMQRGRLASAVARLLMKVVSYEGVVEGDCEVHEVDRSRQTRVIFDHG